MTTTMMTTVQYADGSTGQLPLVACRICGVEKPCDWGDRAARFFCVECGTRAARIDHLRDSNCTLCKRGLLEDSGITVEPRADGGITVRQADGSELTDWRI